MGGGESSVLTGVQGGGIIEEEVWLGGLTPEIRGLEGTLPRVASPSSLASTCFRGCAPTVATAEPPCVEQVEPLLSGALHMKKVQAISLAEKYVFNCRSDMERKFS